MSSDPTRDGYVTKRANDQRRPPAVGVVTGVHYHDDKEDTNNHDIDIELPRTGGAFDRVPVAVGASGEVRLPNEGEYVLVLFLAGKGRQPIVVGTVPGNVIQQGEGRESGRNTIGHRPPLASEGAWRNRFGEAVFETVLNDAGERVVRIGSQPDDAGPITAGLTMNLASGSFSLTDGSGGGVEADGDGNLNFTGTPDDPGGDPGDGFPSVPTGGAGGDGTGVGQPGFAIDQTIDAVADLGLDRNGGDPINDAIEGVADNTRVEFPPGTYRVLPTNDDGIELDGSDVWLTGAGDRRGGVRFQLPAGKAGTGFTLTGSNVGISNATFDHSNHEATVFGISASGGGDKYFYNVQHVGRNLPSLSLGDPLDVSPEGLAHCWSIGMAPRSVCHVENYLWKDPETPVRGYPNGLIGMQAPVGHEGTLELVNNHMAYRSEHNVYASRCAGDVHVTGGYYHNSANTNMRIEGAGSYLEDATIHVDMNNERVADASKAVRGLRWENNKSTASSGGRVTNCDFIHTSQIAAGVSAAITVEYDTAGLTVENSRFRFDDDTSPVAIVEVPDVTFENCSFTGASSSDVVQGDTNTRVLDCCNGMSGGFPNCTVRGLTTTNCTRATK